eukprot:m.143596 g.143596  ORF g.143596 m.143596 type:complete len:294 (+) comp14102_c0_seq1:59-940(+)
MASAQEAAAAVAPSATETFQGKASVMVRFPLDGTMKSIAAKLVPNIAPGSVVDLPCCASDENFATALHLLVRDLHVRDGFATCTPRDGPLSPQVEEILECLRAFPTEVPNKSGFSCLKRILGDESLVITRSFCGKKGRDGWNNITTFRQSMTEGCSFYTLMHFSKHPNATMAMVSTANALSAIKQGINPSTYTFTSGRSYYLKDGTKYGGPSHVAAQAFEGSPGGIDKSELLSVKVDVPNKSISYKKGSVESEAPWVVGWTDIDTAEPLYFCLLCYSEGSSAEIVYAKVNQVN